MNTTQLSPKEAELIQGLRAFRNARHNPSWEIEEYLDTLYNELKEEEE